MNLFKIKSHDLLITILRFGSGCIKQSIRALYCTAKGIARVCYFLRALDLHIREMERDMNHSTLTSLLGKRGCPLEIDFKA
jgi:hypothetical protein